MQNRLNKKFFLLLLFRCFLSNSRFRPIATPQIVNSSSQNVSLTHCKPPFAHSPTFASAHCPLVFVPSDALSLSSGLSRLARVYSTIVRDICLQSFTFWFIGLLFRWLRVKAKALLPSPESGDFSLSRVFLLCTDDEGFIGLGEGSEGKMQGYCVV